MRRFSSVVQFQFVMKTMPLELVPPMPAIEAWMV
jgi:hypothetical protein